jgi:hypothetical protein
MIIAENLVSTKTTEQLLTHAFDLTPRPGLATDWHVGEDGHNFKPDRWQLHVNSGKIRQ